MRFTKNGDLYLSGDFVESAAIAPTENFTAYGSFDGTFDLITPNGDRIAPVGSVVATLRPEEGVFGGAVAVEEGTENIIGNGHFGGGNDIENAYGHSNPQYFEIIPNPHKTGLGAQFDYVLRFNATEGDYCEYEVHPKNGYSLTPGIYTLSLYAYVSPDWDGQNQLLHSRWYYDGTNKTTSGGFPTERGRWERISTTIDLSDATNVTDMNFYIGYSQRSTKGYVLVTGVQVEKKPYPTSFVDGTRAAGRLAYPASVVPLNEGTIAGWFYFSPGFFESRYAYLWTTKGQPYYPLIRIQRYPSGVLAFRIRNENQEHSEVTIDLSEITIGWHHVTATWSSSRMRMYFDGNLVGEEVVPPLPQSADALYVGYNPSTEREEFNGLIDELLILPYAASDEEIDKIYRGTVARVHTNTALEIKGEIVESEALIDGHTSARMVRTGNLYIKGELVEE